MNKKRLTDRIYELDLLRAVAVFLMIFDHAMFDLWGLFPGVFENYPGYEGIGRTLFLFSRDYWSWDVRLCVRYVVVFVFLALVGISCSFSRSNIKRGLKLGVVALLLSAVTGVVGAATGEMDLVILFGVLHCIALGIIAVGIVEKITKNKWVYLVLGVLSTAIGIFVVGVDVPYVTPNTSELFSQIIDSAVGTVMCGGDSFPVFLNCGQIFIGVFLGKQLYRERRSLFSLEYKNGLVSFVGRHSLPVYVLHQGIIPVILGALLMALGYHF